MPSRRSSGQQRLNQLLREVRDRLIGRQTVLTVGQQDDSPKRARDARIHLRPEGIVVLGHQESHPHVAHALGMPVPIKGEWSSPASFLSHLTMRRPNSLDGQFWARARGRELLHPEPDPAPDLPDGRKIDGQAP
ncbi:NaeI family type II restriction endonuclease [Streptomyces sviceus]|uniref:NaeI family type II restriction endonuclease n=1 Tax=Streptomyces sviceus TaxID=285530 RepID=UPI0036754BCC